MATGITCPIASELNRFKYISGMFVGASTENSITTKTQLENFQFTNEQKEIIESLKQKHIGMRCVLVHIHNGLDRTDSVYSGKYVTILFVLSHDEIKHANFYNHHYPIHCLSRASHTFVIEFIDRQECKCFI